MRTKLSLWASRGSPIALAFGRFTLFEALLNLLRDGLRGETSDFFS